MISAGVQEQGGENTGLVDNTPFLSLSNVIFRCSSVMDECHLEVCYNDYALCKGTQKVRCQVLLLCSLVTGRKEEVPQRE